MQYYFTKIVRNSFDGAVARLKEELSREGFGVLTELDMQATLKRKLDFQFRPYKIFGACHPPFGKGTLQIDRHIGLLLPCNFVVQKLEDGSIEVSGVNPAATMSLAENPEITTIAEQVRDKIARIIEAI